MPQKVAGNIVIRLTAGADEFVRSMQKASESTKTFGVSTRGMGSDLQRAGGGFRTAAREGAEFATVMILGAKAIAAQTTATGALEAAVNRLRAARVGLAAATSGLSGAIVAGTEIATVVAIERIAESAYQRVKQIQATALAAQKAGFSYQDTSALQFAAQRIGKPPDYFDSAVKSAGGVAQLAAKLRELAEIKDPLARSQMAFEAFGKDAEKVLANLGDRFGENIERAKEWGFVLDDVSRSKITLFHDDIVRLTGVFDNLTDSIAASKQNFVSLLQLDFSGMYELLTRGPGTLLSAVKPNIAFSTDTLDTKGAQRDIQGRSSANAIALAQQEMLRKLTGPAEASFSKDYFGRDQEDSLRTEIEALQKQLFVQDRTSPDFGKLTSGASFPGGYGAQAEAVQKYTSDEGRLARVIEAKRAIKDADEAAKKAAAELATVQRSVAAALQAAQLAELSGADRLRAERDNAISQYGKTKQLIADINKEFDIKFAMEGKSIIAQSDADMKARAAAEAKAQESQLNARTKYTSDAVLNTINTSAEAPGKRDEVATQGADIVRETQLRQIEGFNAKTLAQTVAVENAKAQIETDYFLRVQEIETQGIDRGYQKQLQELKVLLDAKLISQKAYDDQARALEENEQLDILKVHERTDAEIQKSGIAAAKAISEAYRTEFQKIDEVVKSVLGRVSDNLANLVTGKKTSFGKMFEDMGHQMTSNAIGNGLQALIAPLERRAVLGKGNIGLPGTGKIGDTVATGDTLAGVGAPKQGFSGILDALFGRGKMDGSTASNAFWVRLATDTGSPLASGGPGAPPGAGGSKKGGVLFGNGGLLGTGQVPTLGSAGSASDQAAQDDAYTNITGHDPGVRSYDQYGFRIRAPQSINFGKNQAKPPKPPAWLKWIIGGATGLLSGQGIGGFLSGIPGTGSGGGGDTPDVSSSISFGGDDGGGDSAEPDGFASGGPVKKGVPIIVGEKGHELFIPHSNGRIIDHETTKRMTAAPKRISPRADGGDVSAGQAYLVGERGPETFMPAGQTAQEQASRRTPGNGGVAYYSIDARGTDPVLTEQRVKASLIAVHGSAVSTAIQGMNERTKRTPAARA